MIVIGTSNTIIRKIIEIDIHALILEENIMIVIDRSIKI